MKLSPEQLEQISKSYSELCDLHPELRDEEQRRKVRKGVKGLKRKRRVLATIVNESAPGYSDDETERRVEELVVLSEGRPALLVENGDYDLSDQDGCLMSFASCWWAIAR